MKIILLVSLYAVISVHGYNPDADECTISNVDLNWIGAIGHTNNVLINDTYSGIVEKFNSTNVKDIFFDDPKYIAVTFKDQKAVFSTTDEFRNYEENESTNSIVQILHISCDQKNYTAKYRQYIRDVSKHPPVFNQNEYNFIFYNSLVRGFDLSNVIPIYARDIDITTTYLFSQIEPKDDDITFTPMINSFPKKFSFYARANRTLVAPYDKKFTLSVRDDTHATFVNATLHLQLKNVDTTFKFLKDNYDGIYTGSTKGGNVIFTDNELISFVDGVDNEIKINITGENFTYFQTNIDFVHNAINLKYTPPLNAIGNEEYTLKLIANWRGEEDIATVNVIDKDIFKARIALTTTTTIETITELPNYKAISTELPIVRSNNGNNLLHSSLLIISICLITIFNKL